MRSVVIALLLAGAATPAIAGDIQFRPRGGDHRGNQSDDSSSSSEARPSRPQRSAEPRHESGGGQDNGQRHQGMGRQQSFGGGGPAIEQGGGNRDAGDSVRNWRRQQVVETPTAEPQHVVEPRVVRPPRGGSDSDVQQSGGDSVRHWRSRDRDGGSDSGPTSIEERNLRRAPSHVTDGDLVQQRHPLPAVLDRHERRISRTPIRGTEPPAPRTVTSRLANPTHRWSGDWRHDRRYDWRSWRRHHRSHFNFGFYYDPFGWDYFRYGIGWRLWPSYYRSSYWLNDPWQWRLPPAYGPYRWVRYYDDALLVNIYTGEVVDVDYNFFW